MLTYFLSAENKMPEEEGKPFPFLRTGIFTDRNGRQITIDNALLDDLVAAFSEKKGGADVPVDVQHRMDEAAGWIVSIYRRGSVLYAIPQWNTLGKRLIGDKMYRFVSAAIDRKERMIRAISLTNFPAITGLAPVELEADNEPGQFAWTDNDVPAKATNVLSPEENKMTIAQNNDPTKSNEAHEGSSATKAATDITNSAVGGGGTSTVTISPDAAEFTEDTTTSDAIVADMSKQLRAEMLEGARHDLRELMREIQQEMADMRRQMVDDLRADLTREHELAEFSQALTSTGAHALPIAPDELLSILKALPDEGRTRVMNLLKAISEGGTVDFTERGTSAASPGAAKKQLDPAMIVILEEHLAGGGSLDEFFKINQDLIGSPDLYDLTAFQTEA